MWKTWRKMWQKTYLITCKSIYYIDYITDRYNPALWISGAEFNVSHETNSLFINLENFYMEFMNFKNL